MQVYIHLTTAGAQTGPLFSIFADVPGWGIAVYTGIPKQVLTDGVYSLYDPINPLSGGSIFTLDDAAEHIILRSSGGACDDFPMDIIICTTTTTTTEEPEPPTTTTTSTTVEPEPTTTTTSTTLERVDHLFFGSVFAEGTYTFSLDASPGVSQEISATLNVNIWEVQGVTPHADNPWIMPFTILNGQTTPVATINKTPAAPCVWTIADVSVTSMVPDIADVEYSGNVIYP
jgi:hypothetical protein